MDHAPSRLVLFDIDGTLLTCAGISGRAIGEALAEVAGAPVDQSGYSFAGRTDPEIVRDLLTRAGLAPARIDRGVRRVLAGYVTRFRQDVRGAAGPRLYPGVRELLERLAADPQVSLGLLTGNVEEGAAIKLGYFGIERFFPIGAFGSDDADRNRLMAVAVARARAHTGVEFASDAIVIVGDTPRDIECARRYGARAVAVATGTYSFDELAAHRPDALFHDLTDTERVLGAIRAARA